MGHELRRREEQGPRSNCLQQQQHHAKPTNRTLELDGRAGLAGRLSGSLAVKHGEEVELNQSCPLTSTPPCVCDMYVLIHTSHTYTHTVIIN